MCVCVRACMCVFECVLVYGCASVLVCLLFCDFMTKLGGADGT